MVRNLYFKKELPIDWMSVISEFSDDIIDRLSEEDYLNISVVLEAGGIFYTIAYDSYIHQLYINELSFKGLRNLTSVVFLIRLYHTPLNGNNMVSMYENSSVIMNEVVNYYDANNKKLV